MVLVCELSPSGSAESRSETGGATESVVTGSARIFEATHATRAHTRVRLFRERRVHTRAGVCAPAFLDPGQRPIQQQGAPAGSNL
jgi:hypothetical protein